MLGRKGSNAAWDNLVRADYALQLVEDRADIDISGPEFNFVRSIRVFDVRYARQHCQSAANRDPLSASKNDPLGAPG